MFRIISIVISCTLAYKLTKVDINNVMKQEMNNEIKAGAVGDCKVVDSGTCYANDDDMDGFACSTQNLTFCVVYNTQDGAGNEYYSSDNACPAATAAADCAAKNCPIAPGNSLSYNAASHTAAGTAITCPATTTTTATTASTTTAAATTAGSSNTTTTSGNTTTTTASTTAAATPPPGLNIAGGPPS